MKTGATPEQAVLQLYAWRAQDRFLFIASSGGTTDLVKEQPISPRSLERIEEAYQKLAAIARTRKSALTLCEADAGRSALDACSDLGRLLRRLILHPDIRELLESSIYGELSISTNEFGIPWELVGSGSSFLSLLHPVTRRLQTGRARRHQVSLARREHLRILLAHNPTDDLPGADIEAREIRRILDSEHGPFEITAIRGRDIERFALLEAIASHDVFHYAGHAHFDPGRPKESALVLSDGLLFASELSNYLCDSPPLLVFLNACESSRFADAESVIAGAELASLADAFISVGVTAVIGASLPVGDEQAGRFSSTFYKAIHEGETVARAVHQARRMVAEEFGIEDSTWASFLFFGSGNLRIQVKSPFSPPTSLEIDQATTEAVNWLLQERAENGHWCDRVYREQGPANIGESLEALAAARLVPPTTIHRTSMEALIAGAHTELDATPYEPKGLGSFTSSVCHALSGLLAGWRLKEHIVPVKEFITALHELVSRLMKMQCPDGGWSWGIPASTIPTYTLFTTEAIDSLLAYRNSGVCAVDVAQMIDTSLRRAQDFLISSQRKDGGWGVHDQSPRGDPANTCYTLTSLAVLPDGIPSGVLRTSCEYLQGVVDLDNLRDDTFFIDHRVVLPDRPPTTWPHFEDYSGLGGLLQALIACEGLAESFGELQLKDRLARHLLDSREPARGWPARYSTIYVTAYYVRVLAEYSNSKEPRKEK